MHRVGAQRLRTTRKIGPRALAADELGYRIKLLGVAQRTAGGIEQRVHPTMIPKSSSVAQVMGVTNAVTIDASIEYEASPKSFQVRE